MSPGEGRASSGEVGAAGRVVIYVDGVQDRVNIAVAPGVD